MIENDLSILTPTRKDHIMFSKIMQSIRKVLVYMGKKSVTVKTVCSVCDKDLNKSFKADMTQNSMARRHFITYGKVLSHGYCDKCYNEFMETEMKKYKAAKLAAV